MLTSYRTRLLAGCAATLGACFSSHARGGNDDEVFVGNRAAMMGGAVAAAVRDGSAAWYNPAGLGGVERDQIDASASVYTLRAYSAPAYMSAVGGENEDAAVREFFSVPSQVAYERRLAPGLGLGLAYFAPKSTNLLLRQQLTTGSADAGSRWQLTLAQTEIQHRVVAAVGYQFGAGLRAGVSLVGGYDTGITSVAVFGAVNDGDRITRTVSSSALGTYNRASLELGLGAQLEITPALHVAVFGRSPTVQLRRLGDSHFSTAEGRHPSGGEAELSGAADKLELDEGLAIVRGGRIGLGLGYRVSERCLVSAEADLQPALHNAEADVMREAVFNARFGVYYQFKGLLGVGAGLFTDRSPDQLTRGEISTTGDFYGGSVGVELGERHFLAQIEREKSLVFSTTVALRYAHSAARTTRIIVDTSPAATELFQSAPGNMQVHELSLYLGTGFAF
jgi:hypothetical protein